MSIAKSGQIEDFNVVRFGGDLGSEVLPELLPKLLDWARLPVGVHLFDLKSVTRVDAAAARALTIFAESLSDRATIVSINAAPVLHESLAAHKLTEILAPSESLAAALTRRAPKLDASMSKEFLVPFQSGLATVLASAADLKTEFGRPQALRQLSVSDDAWAAWLELDLGPYVGWFGFLADEESLQYLHRALLGESGTHESLLDCAMEVLNMTYGFAKRELADKKGFTPKRVLPASGVGVLVRDALSGHHFVTVEIPAHAGPVSLRVFLELGVKP